MAATTQAPWQRLSRTTSQAPMPTGSLTMSRAATLALNTLRPAQAARAMAAAAATRLMAAATLVEAMLAAGSSAPLLAPRPIGSSLMLRRVRNPAAMVKGTTPVAPVLAAS